MAERSALRFPKERFVDYWKFPVFSSFKPCDSCYRSNLGPDHKSQLGGFKYLGSCWWEHFCMGHWNLEYGVTQGAATASGRDGPIPDHVNTSEYERQRRG